MNSIVAIFINSECLSKNVVFRYGLRMHAGLLACSGPGAERPPVLRAPPPPPHHFGPPPRPRLTRGPQLTCQRTRAPQPRASAAHARAHSTHSTHGHSTPTARTALTSASSRSGATSLAPRTETTAGPAAAAAASPPAWACPCACPCPCPCPAACATGPAGPRRRTCARVWDPLVSLGVSLGCRIRVVS